MDSGLADPEETLIGLEDSRTDPPAPTLKGMEELRRYYYRLPPRDVDYLTLYYEQGLRQRQIAQIFECTQCAVSYALQRAVWKLQWLSTVPELDRKSMESDLWELTGLDREVLWGIYETTSGSATARRLKTTQTWVSHQFRKIYGWMVTLDRAWSDSSDGRLTPDGMLLVSRVSSAMDRRFARSGNPALRRVWPSRPPNADPSRFRPYLEFYSAVRSRSTPVLSITEFDFTKKTTRPAKFLLGSSTEPKTRKGP